MLIKELYTTTVMFYVYTNAFVANIERSIITTSHFRATILASYKYVNLGEYFSTTNGRSAQTISELCTNEIIGPIIGMYTLFSSLLFHA